MYKIQVKKRKLMLLEITLLNVPEYPWMCLNVPEYHWKSCLNKQDSEFSSGPKYAKILNMAKL